MKLNESTLKKKIIEWLNSQPGTFAFRVEMRPGMAHGCSDIICCHCGHFVAIEVMMPGNRPTPLQERFLDKVKGAFGTSIVIYSLGEMREQFKLL